MSVAQFANPNTEAMDNPPPHPQDARMNERIDRARRAMSESIRNPTHRTYKPAARGIPNVQSPNQRQRRRDAGRKGGR